MSARGSRLGAWPLLVACALIAVDCGNSSPTGPSPPGPTPGQGTVLVGAGDISICGSPNAEATARLLDGVAGTVMAVGDLVYMTGSPEQFRDCYDPTWGRHKSRTNPVPGNHDYGTPDAAGYFGYWGSRAGPAGLGYYSYRLGNWLILALNSNIPADVGSPQHEWLRGVLASNTSTCVAAYMHHPLFSSGPNGDNPHVRALWQLMYDRGVELVVSGHEHVYERYAPQDPGGRSDPTRGIRLFIAGTGGHSLYEFVRVKPNSEVRGLAFGVLKLTLADGRYDWQFLAVPGSGFSDNGSEMCR